MLKNGKVGTSKKVYQYAIGSDTWTEAAPLNRGRKNHSSCVVGDSIYICGGLNKVREYCESIEKLTVFASAPSDKNSTTCWSSYWEVLNIVTPKIKSFLMVPVSMSEILFLGGERYDETICEVSALNLKEMSWKVVYEAPSSFGFHQENNSYQKSQAGVV